MGVFEVGSNEFFVKTHKFKISDDFSDYVRFNINQTKMKFGMCVFFGFEGFDLFIKKHKMEMADEF